MVGLVQVTWLQERVYDALGVDCVEIDDTKRTRFTYANGQKGESLGRAGLPHPLGLVEDGGHIWFTMVETPSPTLLGLDYLDSAGCYLTPDGKLVYGDGHEEALVRLRSGHWGLPLI